MKHLHRLFFPLLVLLTACTSIERGVVVDTPPPAPPAAQAPAPAPVPEAPAAEPAEAAEPASDGHDPATAPLDADIPLDSAIRTGTLGNGLRYFIRTNQKPENRAELRLFINAGSLQEDDDQQGLAHFVEHMAFNGTQHFEKQEIVDFLESIGMRFGADLNAYTSFDETVYMLTLPTDDAGVMEKGFRILADWASGVTFDGEEIDKERGVVVEEWRLGRGAGARLRDRQFPIIFKDSRYAERLPIGKKEIIEEAPHEVLKRFYRDWYRPDLMAVAAVGDFDPDAVEKLLRGAFEPIPAVASPRPRELPPVPPHEETLFSLATDPELTRTNIAILYKHPAQGEGTYGDYRRSLVQRLYNGMLNNRLDELTQQADPPFLFGFSSMGAFVRSATIFSQQAGVRENEIERGLDALLTEVERVDRHGFTETELERIKTNVMRGYEQAYRERDKQRSGSFADEYGRHFLEGESAPGIAVELALAERFLPTITLDEVNRLARDWITRENRVILVSGPEKDGAPLPSEDDLLGVFAAVESREVEPFVDRVLDQPLVAETPTPGEIVERREIEELGVTEWRLSNGVRVVMKPTDFQNDQVMFTAFSPGGNSLVADEDHVSALFATTILDESGLGEFDRIELGKALTGKVAGVQASISELEEGLGGSASPEDLETLFQLAYLQFTAPRLDLEAFESIISRLRVVLKNRESQPARVYQDRLNEIMSRGHHRRRPMSEEMLEEVDPEKALAVYRERFADAGDFTFVFVGNFQPAELEPLVKTWLASLPATGRKETWKDVGVRPPREAVEFEVRKGLEPQSRVNLIFTGDAEWSRQESHLIGSLAQVLRIRLREILREDMGATYGVGVGGSLAYRPTENYSFSISFGCAPEEVQASVDAVFAELERFAREGVDAEYVAKVQEMQRRKRETDVRENSFWLRGLEGYYSRGQDPRLLLDYDPLVENLSPERLQDAARRYFDRSRYVWGTLYPEEAAEEDRTDASSVENGE